MNRLKHIGSTIAVVISVFLIFAHTVWASVDGGALDGVTDAYYIGPGTVYIVMQVVIGLVIGGAAMMGIYRTRVRTFFTNLFASRRRSKEGEEREEAE